MAHARVHQQKAVSQQKNPQEKQKKMKKSQGSDQQNEEATAAKALTHKCTICMAQMPDSETYKQHVESKHPKEESSICTLMPAGVFSKEENEQKWRQKFRQDRRNPRLVLFGRPKTKPKSKSVFSDAEFAAIKKSKARGMEWPEEGETEDLENGIFY